MAKTQLDRYPHVFVAYQKEVFTDVELKICECGLRKDDPIHDRDNVINFLEKQVLELKRQPAPKPEASHPSELDVTVIVSGTEQSIIYKLRMKNFSIDTEYSEPTFSDNFTMINDGVMEKMTFHGKPVPDKDGKLYYQITQDHGKRGS